MLSVEDIEKLSIPINISEVDETAEKFTVVQLDCMREADGCKLHIESKSDSEKLKWTQKSGKQIDDKLWLRTKDLVKF